MVQYFPISTNSSISDFVPTVSQLYTRMVPQGGIKASILSQTKKAFQIYPGTFSKYCKIYDEIIN